MNDKYLVVDIAYDLSQGGECSCKDCVRQYTEEYQVSVDEIVGEHVELIRSSDESLWQTKGYESVSDEIWQQAHDRTPRPEHSTVHSAEDCFDLGELIASKANGSGRGDGWDAELVRLSVEGSQYAPGGVEYLVRYTPAGSVDSARYAWADTKEQGMNLLSAPSATGWEE